MVAAVGYERSLPEYVSGKTLKTVTPQINNKLAIFATKVQCLRNAVKELLPTPH